MSTPRLSQSRSEALRARLEARAAKLRRELGEALHDPQAEDTIALHNRHAETDDDAVADLETDIDVASMERDARELSDVVEALARMDRSEYGACLECGGSIPWERLQAQPHAKRCIHCEEARERASARATPGL